jgi:hypothetical protein
MSSKDEMLGILSVSALEYLNPDLLITAAPHPASVAAFASV